MLDYYFCEQCEAYHPPNRYINGDFLCACERTISTDMSFTPKRFSNMDEHASVQMTKQQSIEQATILNNRKSQNPFTNVFSQYSQSHSSSRAFINNKPFANLVEEQVPIKKTISTHVVPQFMASKQFPAPIIVKNEVPISHQKVLINNITPNHRQTVSIPPQQRLPLQVQVLPPHAQVPTKILTISAPIKQQASITSSSMNSSTKIGYSPFNAGQVKPHLLAATGNYQQMQPRVLTVGRGPEVCLVEQPRTMTSLATLGSIQSQTKLKQQERASIIDKIGRISKLDGKDQIGPSLQLDRVSSNAETEITESDESRSNYCPKLFCLERVSTDYGSS